MNTYEVRPKNAEWTTRKKRAAKAAGFEWNGHAMTATLTRRPAGVWGCKVILYKPPAPSELDAGLLRIFTGRGEFG